MIVLIAFGVIFLTFLGYKVSLYAIPKFYEANHLPRISKEQRKKARVVKLKAYILSFLAITLVLSALSLVGLAYHFNL